jgi:thiol-disulfide isomerase/thioredoxin
MRKTFSSLTALLFFTAPLCAESAAQPNAQAEARAAAQANAQAMLQKLFDPTINEEQLKAALKEAVKAGLPRQQMIEAKLVWGLRQQNQPWLTALLPELQILADNFDIKDTAGIKSADEVRGFILYIHALKASSDDDEAEFKKQITEAFWVNPDQAPLYTQLIQKKRQAAQLAKLKFDLTTVMNTAQGETTTLKEVLGTEKALLLDFWASWCGPCMQLMPELKLKAEHLKKHGVIVVGMNHDTDDAEAKATKVREDTGINTPWLIEPAERPYSSLLGIRGIPHMALITPAGQVLFSGHPQDPQLWTALKKIDSSIQPTK